MLLTTANPSGFVITNPNQNGRTATMSKTISGLSK